MDWMRSSRRLEIYIAGPLFSEAERRFNLELKRLLSPYFNVYLPQEDGGLMVNMIADGVPPKEAARRVFVADVDAMEACDTLLIILDGRAVDEGAAFELGFAFARGKHCVGLRTDPRQLLATGNNPMIESPIREMFLSVEDLLAWARATKKGANTNPPVQASAPRAEEVR
jgi:nucleoside 2-deoxyribosyltransferase